MQEDNLSDELRPWLERRQDRIREMLSAENPMDAQDKFKALVEMGRQFLALSRTFLAMGKTANDAAQSMLPSESKGQPPDGPSK